MAFATIVAAPAWACNDHFDHDRPPVNLVASRSRRLHPRRLPAASSNLAITSDRPLSNSSHHPLSTDLHVGRIHVDCISLDGPSHPPEVSNTTDRVVDRRRAPPCALPLREQLVRPCAVWNTPIAPPRGSSPSIWLWYHLLESKRGSDNPKNAKPNRKITQTRTTPRHDVF
jgi:hypothetical protein